MQQANRQSFRSVTSKVILLVEDHDSYREVVRTALGKYLPGFEIVEAGSIAAALPLLESHKMDVMVVDMTLPDGSAIDLLEQAGQSIEQGMKVIVFSSHSTTEMLPVLSRSDVQGYVSKEHGLKALALVILDTCNISTDEHQALVGQKSALGII
jgi:DNA-binding NarL/FixJ family response regulator